jgi:poly(glycerol-phosphate) alpha-glucosyltransferase
MNSERSVRIAHFTLGRCSPESANGVDKAVYHLARSQAALGHDVAVFSMTEKTPIPIPGVTVFTCPPLRLPLRFLPDRYYDLLVSRAPWNVPPRLVNEIRAWQPDVLHLHFVHIPPNVFLARRLSPAIPYCVTIHGGLSPAAQKRNQVTKRVFRALFERDYLQRAAFLHAISELDVQGLGYYGVTNTTILAPNGIDVESLVAPAIGRAPDDINDRVRGRRIFLFLGRLDPEQKGLDLLLRAFAVCRPVDAALVLVGPNWRGGQPRLETLARSLGIADAVIFTGPAFGARKLELLRATDVFVHPSRWEAGVPFSVLEAAALARPCLLSTAADPAGILERNEAAVCVAPTMDAIADGLRRLSATPSDVLCEIGTRAREVVMREFSWSRTAGVLIEAYRTHVMAVRPARG